MFRQEEAFAREFVNTVQILCRPVSCGLLLKKKKFGERRLQDLHNKFFQYQI
jgi:hypothetical protein